MEANALRHRDVAHYLAVNTIALPEELGAEQAVRSQKVTGSLPAGTVVRRAYLQWAGTNPKNVSGPYGDAAYARLATIKQAYDPGNIFPFTRNFRP